MYICCYIYVYMLLLAWKLGMHICVLILLYVSSYCYICVLMV
jgi:hypothetical protein